MTVVDGPLTLTSTCVNESFGSASLCVNTCVSNLCVYDDVSVSMVDLITFG